MDKEKLIAYSIEFCSFLLNSKISKDINKIILFGSVARGDFDEESDIDLFIDTEKEKLIESELKKVLFIFKKSNIYEKWRLKGLKNEFSFKIGKLKEWKLYRSIVSNGIILYGKFEDNPKNLKQSILFILDFSKIKRNNKISIWRALYGYKQKIRGKTFISKGLLEKIEGKKLEKGVIVIPVKNKNNLLDFIKKNHIKYKISEIWEG